MKQTAFLQGPAGRFVEIAKRDSRSAQGEENT
jgi:hypothetical protein